MEEQKFGLTLSDNVRAHNSMVFEFPIPRFRLLFRAFDKDGNLKWEEVADNLVVNEGRNHALNVMFKSGTQIATWYLGLKGSGAPAATDTLSNTGAWTEVTAYSGNRPSISWGTVSSGSLTASSACSYSINNTVTVAGAFICSVSSGTSGTLYSAANFTTSRSLVSGDTLNVTPTVTATSS